MISQGTDAFIAPEIRAGKGYSGRQPDIFSLGVLLFSMAFGCFPWSETTAEDRYYRSFTSCELNLLKYHRKTRVPYRNGELHEELADLIMSLLTIDRNKRPGSIEQVLEHPFFKKIDDID